MPNMHKNKVAFLTDRDAEAAGCPFTLVEAAMMVYSEEEERNWLMIR